MQESRLIASISGDKECIKLFNEGCGDMHSLVAKMAYSDIVKDCPVEQIKEKYHEQRQNSKKIEFAVNYGGDAHTIANNMSMSTDKAQKIYDNYMSGLSGISKYQEYCKNIVLKKGFITINPKTGHKAHWFDWQACMNAMYFYNCHDYDALQKFNNKLHYIKVKFNNSEEEYSPVYLHNIMDYTDTKLVKQKISTWSKRSVNFRIQGSGALCFKLALIRLWKYLIEHDLVFVVKFRIVVHDEFNITAPKAIAKEIGEVLVNCMEEGAKPFCTKVKLSADLEINDYWVH